MHEGAGAEEGNFGVGGVGGDRWRRVCVMDGQGAGVKDEF